MKDLSVTGEGISSTTPKAVVAHFAFLILLVWDVQISHTIDLIGDVKGTVLLFNNNVFLVGLHFGLIVSMCKSSLSWKLNKYGKMMEFQFLVLVTRPAVLRFFFAIIMVLRMSRFFSPMITFEPLWLFMFVFNLKQTYREVKTFKASIIQTLVLLYSMNNYILFFYCIADMLEFLATSLYGVANERCFFFLLYGERKWENLSKLLMI